VPVAALSKGAGDGGRDIMGKHEVVVVRVQGASPSLPDSVAVAQASHFQKKLDIKSSKIDRILKIFEQLDLPKSQWVLWKH
jgi:hypothetical protein